MELLPRMKEDTPKKICIIFFKMNFPFEKLYCSYKTKQDTKKQFTIHENIINSIHFNKIFNRV